MMMSGVLMQYFGLRVLGSIRAIPLKNPPLNSKLGSIRGGFLSGGILIRPPNPKNFRLRRAKKNLIFFLNSPEFFLDFFRFFSRNFLNFPDFFLSNFFPPAAGKIHEFLFLRVYEDASIIRESI